MLVIILVKPFCDYVILQINLNMTPCDNVRSQVWGLRSEVWGLRCESLGGREGGDQYISVLRSFQ